VEDLVARVDEVIENVHQFNLDLEARTEIINQLSQFKHWYHIPSLDSFGPSKYIGYKGMNTSRYRRGRDKDGRRTEAILRKWFVALPGGSRRWQEMFGRVEQLLLRHGKKPNKNVRIHVPKHSL
jgi:hypothetical protein